MKKWVSVVLAVVLIASQLTGLSALAEDKKVEHAMFVVDDGLSEEEYSEQKQIFANQVRSSSNAGTRLRMRRSVLSANNSISSVNGNTLSNDYVEFAVDPEKGRFTVGTVEGNPTISSDDHKIMLYGHNSPWSSYTTIHAGGDSYIYGDSGFVTSPHFDGNANYSEAQFGNINVQQVISIVENSSTQREDIVEIKYIVTNKGSRNEAVGLRIMLDTMLGDNDAAPFRIPGIGDLTTEKEFSGDDIPQYWQAFDSLNSPKVVSHGNFVSVPIKPNKVQFTNWRNVYNTPWDYKISEGSSNGDSAVSIIWERTLPAGAQEEYVSRYGLSELLQDLQPPLGLTIASGGSVLTNSTNDAYLPYTITVYVQNIGTATSNNVTCKLQLPNELAFVDSGETGTIRLGSMRVGAVETIEKTVYVKKSISSDTRTSFQVSVSADNTITKSLTKEITIPALKKPETTQKTGVFKYGGQIDQTKDSTAKYYYADSYFDNDSKDPNANLATMSLCFELSAWTSHEVKKYRNGKLLIDWPNATKNAKNLLTEIGFEDFEQNDYWSNAPSMHSLGAVAAYKNIGDYTVVALGIRGGGYEDEWGGNFVLGASGNHEGFQRGRDEAIRFLNKYVRDHKSAFKSTLKIWVVGYSRGAAVANMTAGQLIDLGACGGIELKPSNIFAYTFEAPQGYVGSNSSSKYKYIHNYINTMDIVPFVAPSVWNFQRYNKTLDTLLSSSLGTKEYSKRVEDIRTQLITVLDGVPTNGTDFDYDPNQYAMKIDVTIKDISYTFKWLPFPHIEVIPKINWTSRDLQLPVNQMLMGTMNSIFSNIPNGRSGYVNNVEHALSNVAAFFMGYEHEIDWPAVLRKAFFDNYAEGTREIIGILLNPFSSSAQKATNAAAAATKRISDAALQQAGTNLSEVLTALENVLKAAFEATIDDPQQFFGFIYYLAADNGFYAHYPEVTLAAVMAQDSNYNRTYSGGRIPQSYRMVMVACPVDVYVYDEDNHLISQIVNDSVMNILSDHGAAITDTDTKQVILPSDEAYNIRIEATDDGEMTVSVLEYDDVLNHFTLLMGYQNVKIQKGETYQVTVPEYILDDYQDLDENGSSTHYRLIGPKGEDIAPSIVKRGGNIEYYQVAVSSNNQKGIVTGGGRFVTTSFAKVEAAPLPTVEFLGWYENDRLVSTDEAYRFPVNQNTHLVARFSEGSFHKLSVSATKGGSVNIDEIDLPEGVSIELVAEPKENYKFVKWETTSGTLQNNLEATTLFTMPANEASVTAIFELTGPASFEDVAVPSDTFSFKKVWEGGSEKSIDFTLYKLGDTVYHHGFDKKVISKTEWQYNAWFSEAVACYVIEEPVEGYKTRYENVGVYAGITDRCCDGGTIVNYKVPKTGDSANLMLWLGCALAGLALISASVYAGKRKKAHSK